MFDIVGTAVIIVFIWVSTLVIVHYIESSHKHIIERIKGIERKS